MLYDYKWLDLLLQTHFFSMSWNLGVLFHVESLVGWVLQVRLGYIACVYVCPFFWGQKILIICLFSMGLNGLTS